MLERYSKSLDAHAGIGSIKAPFITPFAFFEDLHPLKISVLSHREDMAVLPSQTPMLTAVPQQDKQIVVRTAPRPVALETVDERSLIECCQSGERSAWNELARRFKPLIFSFARSLCYSADDAGDITAEVFKHLVTSLHTFRCDDASFKSWLYRIIHNTYVDVCIRDSNHGHLSLDAPLSEEAGSDSHQVRDTAPTAEMLCVDKDQVKRWQKGVQALPAYQRQVLALFVQGRSYEEITAETGLSLGTVKSRLNRARKNLQERMQEDERLTALIRG